MKTTQITQRTLIESYIRNNDVTTARYMRKMNENFVIPFNKSLLLNEVALDANTINQIFAQAEAGMTGQGANRTALGKGADVAGAVGSAAAAGAKAVGQGAAAVGKGAVDLAKKGAAGVKELADKILNQNKANFEKNLPPADAGEVQGFEQQAQQAAAQIQDPKAKQTVMGLIQQGLKNPVAQTLILTAVGSIATVVAGPAIAGLGLGMAATGALTGTVVGGLTKLVQAKMQGKGWKDAGKDALKGAAMGAAVGGIGGGIAQAGQAAFDAYKSHQQQQATAGEEVMPVKGASLSVGQELPNGEKISGLDSSNPNAAVTITKPDGGTYTVSRDTAHSMTGQQGISNQAQAGGPVSGGASSDPMAGVSDPNAAAGGGMKNPDGSAMTNAQLKANMDRVAPVAGGDADPNKYYNSLSPEQQRATDDAIVAQARGNSNPVTPSTPSDGSYQQAAPIGRDGKPMTQVPMDEPAVGNVPNQGRLKLNQWRQETGSPNAVQEAIDTRQTARRWILQESLGKQRSGYVLTDEAVSAILEGKIGDWFKKIGSNLTNKVTADKLKTAWNKAGMPNDSEAIAGILSQAGVGQTIVQDIFKQLGVPATGQTGAKAPEAPKQGMLGKMAGAVGGAIGSVKGAVQGAKDAYAGQQAQDQAASRATQAGQHVGAADKGQEQPAAQAGQQGATQQPAQAQAQAGQQGTPQQTGQTGGQQPAQAQAGQQPAQAQAGQQGTPQQTGQTGGQQGQTQSTDDEGSTVGDNLKATGKAVAGGIKGLQGAMQAGVGMGTAGQSLMTPKAGDDMQTVKDAQGKSYQYKKVGEKWVNMADNKEVDPATAAMLDRQQKQKAAGAAANAEMDKNKQAASGAQQPDKMLANPKDPKTGKPIDPKAQAAAGGAQQPAQAAAGGAQQPAQAAAGQKPAYDTQTGVANDAMKAVNKAAGKATAPHGFNTQTGEPNPAPGQESETGEVSPEYRARQKAATTPGTPEHSAIQDQIIANADENKLRVFAASAQTPGTKEKAAAELKRRGLSVEEPAAAAATAQQADGKDVQARIAKQLTPNFGAAPQGYSSVKMNAPTGIPQVGGPQPTTGAKAVPVQQPAATPAAAPAPTASAQADADKPGFLQSKIKGSQVPAAQPAAATPAKPGFLQTATDKIAAKAAQPQMASIDFSAILARKAKIQL